MTIFFFFLNHTFNSFVSVWSAAMWPRQHTTHISFTNKKQESRLWKICCGR